jgi:hypothetical protein
MAAKNFFGRKKEYKLQDVFAVKVGGPPPLTYVKRNHVDEELEYALDSDGSVLLYGASKQGKTSLWNMCRDEGDVAKSRKFIPIPCQDLKSTRQIYESMLKGAGYDIEVSRSESYVNGGGIRGKVKSGIPSALSVAIEGSEENKTTQEFTYRSLDLDYSNVSDIVLALNGLGRLVFVLEDFHYIPDDVQKQFSNDFKGIVENSSCIFIIVGAWASGNRMTLYNGEMAQRITSVRADEWSTEQLREVIGKGEDLLNIEFAEEVKEILITECRGNVSILQEICSRVCYKNNVKKTQKKKIMIDGGCLDEEIKKVIGGYDERYRNFIRDYCAGKKNKLHIRKRILNVIFNTDVNRLVEGISYADLVEEINKKFPAPINSGNITQALNTMVEVQRKKNIRPVVIGYDRPGNRLVVLDPTFITWLRHQNKEALIKMVSVS